MKVIDVTFGQAVRCPNNKQETFLSSLHSTLEWNGSFLKVTQPTCTKTVIVFPTNISHMTISEEEVKEAKKAK